MYEYFKIAVYQDRQFLKNVNVVLSHLKSTQEYGVIDSFSEKARVPISTAR